MKTLEQLVDELGVVTITREKFQAYRDLLLEKFRLKYGAQITIQEIEHKVLHHHQDELVEDWIMLHSIEPYIGT